MRRNPERLTDCEDAHGDDHYVDAVGELRDAEGKPRLTADCINADKSDGQSENE
jgi:hypothetical protein